MGYFFFRQGEYGVLSFSEMFIAFMLFIKVLESWRAFILDLAVLSSFAHYKSYDTANKFGGISQTYSFLEKMLMTQISKKQQQKIGKNMFLLCSMSSTKCSS